VRFWISETRKWGHFVSFQNHGIPAGAKPLRAVFMSREQENEVTLFRIDQIHGHCSGGKIGCSYTRLPVGNKVIRRLRSRRHDYRLTGGHVHTRANRELKKFPTKKWHKVTTGKKVD
jgi:hypothetical protein